MALEETNAYQLMMISADMTNEFNIKLILLLLLFLYSIAGIYFSFRIKDDSVHMQIVKYLMFRIPSAVFLFYFPVYTIFLYNAVSAETLLIFVFSYYTIFTVLVFVAFVAFGVKKTFAAFGIEWKSKRELALNKNM